ncbi:argininosuccinate lyase [Clostridium sp.]|uniref:argininosuccinate lyase n=1 Tax=Clostridium sp. TaxID=1506 RepID=UPI00261038A6|nr:argininosuccinate lyase [Clostridium sp.]
MKLWAGRFTKETDGKVNSFNSSLAFDYIMYEKDIMGSIAHAKMLGAQGIISSYDTVKIINGLQSILDDINNKELSFNSDAEDIHMFIEAELTKRIGDAGKRLHTARSRNDQVALDLRLYLIDEGEKIVHLIKEFTKVLVNKAKEHTETIMPGYTHLQRAQPITFGHHLMAYVAMLLRDIKRLGICIENTKVLPLGSCALAGTTYNIDRQMVKELIDFKYVCENSLDGVSDRDFCIELGSDISILMMHLSRLSEEIILWCSWEFKFIELDDSFSTGSSIMPQKKNPDVTELIRGKTGRVYGNLMTLLTMMKGLPLAYNKDMQEDKEAIFDSVETVKMCLETIAPMIETMTVLKDNMKNAAAKGFINATDLADYLTKKGVAFRDAYKISGTLVAWCIKNKTVLEEVPLEILKEYNNNFDNDVYNAISLNTCVKNRISEGGPSPESVRWQIEKAERFLSN